MKRGLCVAVAAATFLLVAATPQSKAQTRPPTHAAGQALLLGDSNMYGSFGHQLTRLLRDMGYQVKLKGRPGSGLARPDFWNWPQQGRQLVQRYRPSVVVIILGGNDVQRMRYDNGSYKDGIAWKATGPWSAEYERRLNALATALMTDATPATRKVFILSPTNRRPPRARERVQRIRQLQRATLARRPDVVWVDTYKLSSNADGDYLKYSHDARGRRLRLRRRDGVHLTRHGASELASALHSELASHMGWPAMPQARVR